MEREMFFEKFNFSTDGAGRIGAEIEVITGDSLGNPSFVAYEVLKHLAELGGFPFNSWIFENGHLDPGFEKALSGFFAKTRIKPELFREQLEFNSLPHLSLKKLRDDIIQGMGKIINLAKDLGGLVYFSGLPLAEVGSINVFPQKRYFNIKREVSNLILGFSNSLHLHFGVESLDEAIFLLNWTRQFLPELLALSANSAISYGFRNDYHSYRFFQHCSFVPVIIPPFLHSTDDYYQRMAKAGALEDADRCWWTIRINPVGTLELRILDGQDTLLDTMFLAGVWKALCNLGKVVFERGIEVAEYSAEGIRNLCLEAALSGMDSLIIKDRLKNLALMLSGFYEDQTGEELERRIRDSFSGSKRQIKLWEDACSFEYFLDSYRETVPFN